MWTDERIDDAMRRIEQRFDALERRMERLEDQKIALRREMHAFMLATLAGYITIAAALFALRA